MIDKPLEWNELWAAMDANPEAWILTTEKMYWEMLEVLPPRKMLGKNFLVGEALRHNSAGEEVYSCFTNCGETYKAKNLTVNEFMREHGYIPSRELR
jgi:hypothetical protein